MFTAKIVLFHQGSTELRRCENYVFFLPVNILTGVTRRLLGPHDTLPCVLIQRRPVDYDMLGLQRVFSSYQMILSPCGLPCTCMFACAYMEHMVCKYFSCLHCFYSVCIFIYYGFYSTSAEGLYRTPGPATTCLRILNKYVHFIAS